MKNKFVFSNIYIIIIVSISLFILCSCTDPTNQLESVNISLPVKDGAAIGMGEIEIVSGRQNANIGEYEILPGDNKFLEFLQSREYFRGTTNLNNEYMLSSRGTNYIKTGDECLWFSTENSVWLGKFYAKKYFYIVQTQSVEIEGDKFYLDLSKFLFNDGESTKSAGIEYPTYLDWVDVKKVFAGNETNESLRTIKLKCTIYDRETNPYLWEDGLTTLVYSEDNKTIKILNEFTKI